jgi:hypothetical protein
MTEEEDDFEGLQLVMGHEITLPIQALVPGYEPVACDDPDAQAWVVRIDEETKTITLDSVKP